MHHAMNHNPFRFCHQFYDLGLLDITAHIASSKEFPITGMQNCVCDEHLISVFKVYMSIKSNHIHDGHNHAILPNRFFKPYVSGMNGTITHKFSRCIPDRAHDRYNSHPSHIPLDSQKTCLPNGIISQNMKFQSHSLCANFAVKVHLFVCFQTWLSSMQHQTKLVQGKIRAYDTMRTETNKSLSYHQL